MEKIKYFLKSNKKQRKNEFRKISNDFVDENGEILDWEIKPLSTEEVEKMREENKDEKKFALKLIASAVVFPNLYSIELQDSYGVKKPEELIMKMLDCPADFYNLLNAVLTISKLDVSLADKIKEAKN